MTDGPGDDRPEFRSLEQAMKDVESYDPFAQCHVRIARVVVDEIAPAQPEGGRPVFVLPVEVTPDPLVRWRELFHERYGPPRQEPRRFGRRPAVVGGDQVAEFGDSPQEPPQPEPQHKPPRPLELLGDRIKVFTWEGTTSAQEALDHLRRAMADTNVRHREEVTAAHERYLVREAAEKAKREAEEAERKREEESVAALKRWAAALTIDTDGT